MKSKKSYFQFLFRYLLSILLALAFSTTLAIYFFDLYARDAIDQLFLIFLPTLAFAFLFSELFSQKKGSKADRFWTAIRSWRGIDFSLQGEKRAPFSKPRRLDLFSTWLAGSVIAFFGVSLFSEFYIKGYEFFILAFLFTVLGGLISYHLIGKIKSFWKEEISSRWIEPIIFTFLLFFVISIVKDGLQFLRVIDKNIFLLTPNQIFFFIAIALFPAPWLTFYFLKQSRYFASFRETQIYKFIQDNLTGILLSALFFIAYFILSSALNQPHFGADDTFFDAG